MKTLIITDNLQTVIEKEINILSSKNIRIFTASSGEDVLKIHRTEKVNLIITDLDIPGMDGDKVTSIIRKDNALKNVLIIIACDNDKSAIARCETCGANTFITKPIKHKELSRKILKFLNISERISLRAISKGDVIVNLNGNLFYAYYENISNSDMLLVTDEFFGHGDKISCMFYIGTEELITIHGEIVRVIIKKPYKYHYGVQFINLSTLLKAKIEKFLEDK